jgi:glycosyltransferase involved in cell wall biosynthesis
VPHATVSIVMPTFDRATTLPRAIDSVLMQDHDEWELIVVDDGSSDATSDVLAKFDDPRIRVVRHAVNRGVTAAKNTGLDLVGGDWFTVLDSDDELVPEALSTLLAVTDSHPDVDAVSCNCQDSVTGRTAAAGPDHDGYIDLRTLSRLSGEYWGITRTSLLGDRRFDERVPGLEGVLWLKLGARGTGYFIRPALRIYHSEGDDRVSVRNEDRERRLSLYAPLADDREYLAILESVDPARYADTVFLICVACVVTGRRAQAWRLLRRYQGRFARKAFLFSALVLGARWVRVAYALKERAAVARP